MTSSPKLSVIIPVFNAVKFLRRCLESIFNQSYSNIEILLIDDGSTDKSSEICAGYADRYECVKYIRVKNGGASKARNIGLLKASGEYYTFVDSDDFLEPNIYSEAIKAFDDGIDIVSFGVRTITLDGKKISERCESERIYDSKDIVRDIIANMNTAVWNKIFRKSIIKSNQFPEELTHNEDMVFFCRCINKNTKLKSIPHIGYNYVKHTGSVTSRSFSKKSFDEIKAKDLSSIIIVKKFPEMSSYMLPVRIRGRLNLLRRMRNSHIHNFNQEKLEIKEWLKNNVQLRNIGWKQRIFYLIEMNDWINKLFTSR